MRRAGFGQLLTHYAGVADVTNSNTKSPSKKPAKPDKPYAGFPLFAHQGSGQWAKKIRRKLEYFGSWHNDRDGTTALQVFNREWPYLKDGRTAPPVDVSEGCTLRKLCNAFLRSKEAKQDAGELSPRTFRDYYKTCEGLLAHFGKERRVDGLRPMTSALSVRYSPSGMGWSV